jgi:hypothetical protein
MALFDGTGRAFVGGVVTTPVEEQWVARRVGNDL